MNSEEKSVLRDCFEPDDVEYGARLAKHANLYEEAKKATDEQLRTLARAWDRLLLSSKRSELHNRKEILLDLWAASVNK